MNALALADVLVKPKSKTTSRPRGVVGKVVSPTRSLGVHHFVFMRSSLLALDFEKAFDR